MSAVHAGRPCAASLYVWQLAARTCLAAQTCFFVFLAAHVAGPNLVYYTRAKQPHHGGNSVGSMPLVVAETRGAAWQVHIISAACENMIDGKGMRPGDILQAANGKTVEVRRTSHEGVIALLSACAQANLARMLLRHSSLLVLCS